MAGLVLEGGTMRPIFSAGVMDALLEEGIMFPYCIGVSAGACEAASYLSKQFKRNLAILVNYRNDPRYLGLRNYFRCKSMFGLDFVFDEIPNKLLPYDLATYQQYKGRYLIGVTNAKTGQAEYKDGMHDDEKWSNFRATCAIPLYFPAIPIDGTLYYDGGISDPIPIRKAITDGNEKNLIILTQPKGYRKTLTKQNKAAAKLLKRRYPGMERALLERHLLYNDTIQFCEELEQAGKAVIFRPEYKLESFEKNIKQLEANWQHGYDMAKQRMSEIKKLFA